MPNQKQSPTLSRRPNERTHRKIKTAKIKLVESIVTWQFHSTTATLAMPLEILITHKMIKNTKTTKKKIWIIGMRQHCLSLQRETDKRHTDFEAARRVTTSPRTSPGRAKKTLPPTPKAHASPRKLGSRPPQAGANHNPHPRWTVKITAYSNRTISKTVPVPKTTNIYHAHTLQSLKSR